MIVYPNFFPHLSKEKITVKFTVILSFNTVKQRLSNQCYQKYIRYHPRMGTCKLKWHNYNFESNAGMFFPLGVSICIQIHKVHNFLFSKKTFDEELRV